MSIFCSVTDILLKVVECHLHTREETGLKVSNSDYIPSDDLGQCIWDIAEGEKDPDMAVKVVIGDKT